LTGGAFTGEDVERASYCPGLAAFQFTVRDGSVVRVEIFLDVEEGRRRMQECPPST
jgi:hypothetical protein